MRPDTYQRLPRPRPQLRKAAGPYIRGNFRNGPLSVKLPSDDLATVIVLPSVVDTRSPHHAIRWEPASQSRKRGPALSAATARLTASPDPRPGSGTSGGGSRSAPPGKISPLVTRRRRPACPSGSWRRRPTCDAEPSPTCAPKPPWRASGRAAWPHREPSASGWKTVSPGSA